MSRERQKLQAKAGLQEEACWPWRQVGDAKGHVSFVKCKNLDIPRADGRPQAGKRGMVIQHPTQHKLEG